MPARTNDYQKIVKIINRQLAPVGAKITESAMLYDSEAETNREIDILIESVDGNPAARMGVECTAPSKPVDLPQMESIREKHRKVGIKSTVVVALNGFTSAVKTYAAKNSIKLLTFNSVKSENWAKSFARLQGLSSYGRTYKVDHLSVDKESLPIGCSLDWRSTFILLNGAYVPLEKFVVDTFIKAELGKIYFKELMENEINGGEPLIHYRMELKQQCVFKTSEGIAFRPNFMSVRLIYKSKYRSLKTRQVTYDGTSMVVGGFYDGNAMDSMHVAFNEVNGAVTGTAEVSTSFLPDPSSFPSATN